MSSRALSRSHLRVLTVGVVISLALLPWLDVAIARAATLEVSQGAGLTEPGGLAETPDGGLWATDGARGVCRLRTDGARPAPVESRFCVAPTEAEGAPRPEGPRAAFQMAFDPETSYFYVAEGSSASGGVWRMRWNPLNGAIGTAVKIADTPGDRTFALALGRTGPPLVPGGPLTNEVYFATRGSNAIRKVANPTGLVPTVQPFGVAQRNATTSLAWLDGQLYLADGSLVTRISTAGGASTDAAQVATLPFPSALVADPVNGRLYVGTDSGALNDSVDVLVPATGLVESYDSGFAGIGALGLGRGGSLLVGDDPVAATGAIGAEGNGRVWRARFSAVNLPGVTITDGPPTYTNQPTATFSYSSRAGASFECRLDDSAWEQCPGEAEGSISYAALTVGTHSFEVRAIDAPGSGRAAQRTFVVDTTAPDATIDNPESDRTLRGDSLALSFSSGETQASFTCALDGAPAEPCRSPRRYAGLSLGEHTVRVSAIDAAGNASDLGDPRSTFSFVVEPTRVEPTPVEPVPAAPPLPSREVPSPVRVDQAPAPAAGPLVLERIAAEPLLRPRLALLRSPRLTRRALLRHRLLRLAFDVPAEARFARVTVQRYSATASLEGGHAIASRRFKADAGRRNRLSLRLTRAQARRLSSPGRYRVTVAVGASAGSFGPSTTLTLRVLRDR